jgi:hypothetical protein
VRKPLRVGEIFSELGKPSCKVAMSYQVTAAAWTLNACRADVEEQQRGEAGWAVEHRTSSFCGDQAGDMAAAAWQSASSGQPDDRPPRRLGLLSCGNGRQFG